jgi:hypothetical protein
VTIKYTYSNQDGYYVWDKATLMLTSQLSPTSVLTFTSDTSYIARNVNKGLSDSFFDPLTYKTASKTLISSSVANGTIDEDRSQLDDNLKKLDPVTRQIFKAFLNL